MKIDLDLVHLKIMADEIINGDSSTWEKKTVERELADGMISAISEITKLRVQVINLGGTL